MSSFAVVFTKKFQIQHDSSMGSNEFKS